MPKLKPHRGAKKRFIEKTSGIIKIRRAYRNHILTKKSTKKKRVLRVSSNFLKKCDKHLVKRMLRGS